MRRSQEHRRNRSLTLIYVAILISVGSFPAEFFAGAAGWLFVARFTALGFDAILPGPVTILAILSLIISEWSLARAQRLPGNEIEPRVRKPRSGGS